MRILGGIADQGGGAAHIGGEDLGNQQGQGVDLQSHGNFYGHRDHEQHGGDVVQEGRAHRRDHLEDEGQDEDVAPGQGIRLVSQPLEEAGLFQDPDNDHHSHEQENDVQVNGPHGVFKREDEVIFVKGAGGVSDEQNKGGAQKGRQGPMHQLGGDEDVHHQEHEAGDPKGRGDLAFQGEVGLDLEEPVAGRISPCPHNFKDLRLLSLPARSQRPDFHRGLRQGPLGQPITPDKAPLTAGFDTLIPALGGEMPPIHQQFNFHLLNPLALGVRNESGQRQPVARLRRGRRHLQGRTAKPQENCYQNFNRQVSWPTHGYSSIFSTFPVSPQKDKGLPG